MKNNACSQVGFLPKLIFLICLMFFSYTHVSIASHIFVLCVLIAFEKLLLPSDFFRQPFLNQMTRWIYPFVFLLVFYSIFLQMGSQPWITIKLFGGKTWGIYLESIIYAMHYVLLFIETYWVAYLLHSDKKFYGLQVLFLGSLYPLTLIWNGSIHQVDQMMKYKKKYDEVIFARGLQLSRFGYLFELLQYLIYHCLWELKKKIPLFQMMWRKKQTHFRTVFEYWIWAIPVLMIVVLCAKETLAFDTYFKIQILLIVTGLAIVYHTIKHQVEWIVAPLPIKCRDGLIIGIAVGWLFFAFLSLDTTGLIVSLDNITALKNSVRINSPHFLILGVCFLLMIGDKVSDRVQKH